MAGHHTMNLTNHAQIRMNQRGITKEMLQMVLDFGDIKNERMILNRKSLDKILQKLNEIKSKILKAKDKGGLVLIMGDDNAAITTYNYDSHQKAK